MMGLEFGLFDTLPRDMKASRHVTGDVADVFLDKISNAQCAETLGYKYLFFIEHQNSAFPAITSSNVYLAALAQATTSIRLGVMVFQLPMHHPVRLAQDIAMVDQLSHGRFEFGFGYGIVAREFEPWKINYVDRRERGVEALQIIRAAWTQEKFSYEGKYWSFDNATPWPHPFQKPHPPIWMGAHSEASFDFAADHNFNLAQNIDTERAIAEKFAYFRKAWAQRGHAGPPPRTLLVRHVHVAETDAKAREEAEPDMLEGILGAYGVKRAASLRKEEQTAVTLENARIAVETSRSFDFWIDEGLAIVGSPETVTRGIIEQQKRCGYDVFAAYHQILSMPHALARKSIEMFGREVIPNFAQPLLAVAE